MKKYIFVSLLMFCVLLGSAWATDFYEPWQGLCKSANGAGTGYIAKVTLEATANQNVFIDQIVVYTDKSNAWLTISEYPRGTGSFEVGNMGYSAQRYPIGNLSTGGQYPRSVVRIHLASLEAVGNGLIPYGSDFKPVVQTLGSGHPEIPLWVGDEGRALCISVEGIAAAEITVNGRRGKVYPANPSQAGGGF